MNVIENFNRMLNKSSDNRYLLWQEYRKKTTDYIIDNLDDIKLSTAVFGAGNSDDIDLSRLAIKTHKLHLFDIDKSSLLTSLKKYFLNQDFTTINQLDFSGLSENTSWNHFIQEVIQCRSKKEIDIIFEAFKNIITNYTFSLNTSYDLIIISPVYTQLLFQQGLSYLNILENLNYPLDLRSYIQEKLLDLMPYVINTFNKNIINLLNPSSMLIVFSDVLEANKNSDFYFQLKTSKNIEATYFNYRNQYGYGLGDYGLENIGNQLREIDSTWFEWPFNNEKSFFVKALILEN